MWLETIPTNIPLPSVPINNAIRHCADKYASRNYVGKYAISNYANKRIKNIRISLWLVAERNNHTPNNGLLDFVFFLVLSLLLFSVVKIGLQQFSWTTDTWDIC
jgi:hypothetical protein